MVSGNSAPHETLTLPERVAKPRKYGLTFCSDVGSPIGFMQHLLEDYANFLDFVKFGVGTAYLTPNLTEKLTLYSEHDITPYFGGTLFEKFVSQKKLDDYCRFLEGYGVDWIEVSCGTIDLTLEERCNIVDTLKDRFNVISEVGCKDTETIMSPSVWIEELQALLDAGAAYVVTEGRDSGSAGIFRPSGELRTGLIADIVASLPVDKVVFEAPTQKAQMFFINYCGSNVNLGNVAPRDALILEAQRQALRYETFHLPEQLPPK